MSRAQGPRVPAAQVTGLQRAPLRGRRSAYEEVQRIAFAPLMFQAARVARDNGLLTALERADTALTPDEAAVAAPCSPYAARLLLEACLSMDLVALDDGRYSIRPAGLLLLRDEMTRVNMDFIHDVCYLGAFHLGGSLRSGRPEGLQVFGDWTTLYEALPELPPHVRDSWLSFDHYYSDRVFPVVLPEVLARRPQRLLDVGGNTGKWAITCTQYDRTVAVTVVDLPAQVERALAAADLAGVGDRVDGHAMDLLDHSRPFPAGYDVVWMSQFLDCFPERDIVPLLRRGREALARGGRLYVVETFWDRQPNPAARHCITATSLYFACMANGTSRMYHSDDMRQCLDEAGLALEDESQHGYHTVLRCLPRG